MYMYNMYMSNTYIHTYMYIFVCSFVISKQINPYGHIYMCIHLYIDVQM